MSEMLYRGLLLPRGAAGVAVGNDAQGMGVLSYLIHFAGTSFAGMHSGRNLQPTVINIVGGAA